MNNNFGDRPGVRMSGLRVIVFATLLVASSLNVMTCSAEESTVVPPDAVSGTATASTPTAEDIATMLNVRFHIGLREALRIGEAVINAARRDTISPFLLLAVIAVESDFNRFAVSVMGARGLMQVLPSQHKDIVLRTVDLTDSSTNVSVGSSILHDYIEASNGDVHDALLRYSGGARGYPQRVADRMSMIKTAIDVKSRNPDSQAASAFRY